MPEALITRLIDREGLRWDGGEDKDEGVAGAIGHVGIAQLEIRCLRSDMSPDHLGIGVALAQAANRIIRLAAPGYPVEATDPGHRIGTTDIQLQGVGWVNGDVGPQIEQPRPEVVYPVPAVGQRVVILLPVRKPEISDISNTPACAQAVVADILASMVGK